MPCLFLKLKIFFLSDEVLKILVQHCKLPTKKLNEIKKAIIKCANDNLDETLELLGSAELNKQSQISINSKKSWKENLDIHKCKIKKFRNTI